MVTVLNGVIKLDQITGTLAGGDSSEEMRSMENVLLSDKKNNKHAKLESFARHGNMLFACKFLQ